MEDDDRWEAKEEDERASLRYEEELAEAYERGRNDALNTVSKISLYAPTGVVFLEMTFNVRGGVVWTAPPGMPELGGFSIGPLQSGG